MAIQNAHDLLHKMQESEFGAQLITWVLCRFDTTTVDDAARSRSQLNECMRDASETYTEIKCREIGKVTYYEDCIVLTGIGTCDYDIYPALVYLTILYGMMMADDGCKAHHHMPEKSERLMAFLVLVYPKEAVEISNIVHCQCSKSPVEVKEAPVIDKSKPVEVHIHGDVKIDKNYGTMISNHHGGIIQTCVGEDQVGSQSAAPEPPDLRTKVPVMPEGFQSAPEKTLVTDSDFVRNRLTRAVMKYYQGSSSNLALIAAVADDWGLLKGRNKCSNFLKTCMCLGAIRYEGLKDFTRIINGMSKKLGGQSRGVTGARVKSIALPPDYKHWPDEFKKDIDFCDKVSKEFEGPGMRYKYS